MKKSFLWILAVTFSLILGQSVYAHSDRCDAMSKMADHMKLDDAQKAKVMPILEQLKTTLKASWTQMKDLRTQIQEQIQSDTMDQATVDGLIDKKTKLIGDMMKAKAAAKHQIYMLLNPQQRTNYQNMVKTMSDKMEQKYAHCKGEGQQQDAD